MSLSGNEVRVYRFEGDFGSHNFWEVQAEIEEILESGCTRLVLNVGRMTFINSSALGYLIKTWKILNPQGGHLVLSEPTEFVTRTMSVLGLDMVFQIYPDDETAVEALGGSTDDGG
jgi:anti-anti-sigma factor